MKKVLTFLALMIIVKTSAQILPTAENKVNYNNDCEKSKVYLEVSHPNSVVPVSVTSDFFPQNNKRGLFMPLSNKLDHPLFSSSGLWFGGIEKSGNLLVSATQKREDSSSDFYPGAFDIDGVADSCAKWDQVFTVYKEDILKQLDLLKKAQQSNSKIDCNDVPQNIKNWPAVGNPFQENLLNNNSYVQNNILYLDVNGDAFYNPCEGDVPYLQWPLCDENFDIPDQVNMWLIHTGDPQNITGGKNMKMQIIVYQYFYKSTTELNDVVFYKYHFINMADSDIVDSYFGLYFDPSLGCPLDDKMAIDTLTNSLIFYNGSDRDNINKHCMNGDSLGYYPYSLAIRYKGRLKAPKVYSKDANGNIILEDPKVGSGDLDTLVNLNLSSFVITKTCNDGQLQGCDYVHTDLEAYNLLRGRKIDGQVFLNEGTTVTKLFTGNPSNSHEWSMVNDATYDGQNIGGLMSFGPMNLQPGAINELNFSLHLIPLVNGLPDFPVTRFQMDEAYNEIAKWQCNHSNLMSPKLFGANNPNNKSLSMEIEKLEAIESDSFYTYVDTQLLDLQNVDTKYRFEGYKVYQLKNEFATLADSNNYKNIYQTDIANSVDNIFQFIPKLFSSDDNHNNRRWISDLVLDSENNGLDYTFEFDHDRFSDSPLVDNTIYHFGIQSYYYNNWKEPDSINGFGQRNQIVFGPLRKFAYLYSLDPNAIIDLNVGSSFICSNGKIKSLKTEPNVNYNLFDILGRSLEIKKSSNDGYVEFDGIYQNELVIVKSYNMKYDKLVTKLLCVD